MSKIDQLLEITAKLRDPKDGCPWDLQQTFETIAPYTLEEAYEVDHAIRGGDMAELCDELGDLLFQVALHARMAEEGSHFAFDDVVTAICDKLVRRHPHVFGDPGRAGERKVFASAEEQSRHWEESKARERAEKRVGPEGVNELDDPFRGIPRELPALTRAAKLRKRSTALKSGGASRHSRDFEFDPDPGIQLGGFQSALDELAAHLRDLPQTGPRGGSEAARTIGALLTRVVVLAKGLGVDPEAALRDTNHEFEQEVLAALRSDRDPAPVEQGGEGPSVKRP
jgi:MazG family protein